MSKLRRRLRQNLILWFTYRASWKWGKLRNQHGDSLFGLRVCDSGTWAQRRKSQRVGRWARSPPCRAPALARVAYVTRRSYRNPADATLLVAIGIPPKLLSTIFHVSRLLYIRASFESEVVHHFAVNGDWTWQKMKMKYIFIYWRKSRHDMSLEISHFFSCT